MKYAQPVPKDGQKELMSNQVIDCVDGLLAARQVLVSNGSLPTAKVEEVALLLHEAADLLIMSTNVPLSG